MGILGKHTRAIRAAAVSAVAWLLVVSLALVPGLAGAAELDGAVAVEDQHVQDAAVNEEARDSVGTEGSDGSCAEGDEAAGDSVAADEPDSELTEAGGSDSELVEAEPVPDTQELEVAESQAVLADDLTSLQWSSWAGSDVLSTGADNPSINVPAFGSAERGANMERTIVVALIDTAVDHTNPDLANVIYRFTPAQQEALGCGEWGYNAVGGGISGSVMDEESVALGHGTHTAGILGAEWDGHGISGVASDVRIVSIELANGEGVESLADALAAFDFIDRFNQQAPEEERIRVVNNSWSEFFSNSAIDDAVRTLGEKWGTVFIFSAGNDGKNNDYYEKTPSTLVDNPYAVVVANTTSNDALSSTSQYGAGTVDTSAPGTGILSTLPDAKSSYIPDATRADNVFYVGFDDESDPQVTVTQLDADGNPVGQVGEVTTRAHFFGENSLLVTLDTSYPVASDGIFSNDKLYDIQIDIDLSSVDAAALIDGVEGLQLGLGFAAADAGGASVRDASTNLGPEGASVITVADTADGQWGLVDFLVAVDDEDNPMPAVFPEDGHLVVTVRVGLGEGAASFYIDSLGLGNITVPYGFASGTSMSAPAVAGAAAVLASRGHEGIELADLVRSMVRVPEGGTLPVSNGGVFDFDAATFAPVISRVSVDGDTVTIEGSNFGSGPGAVDLSRYVVGTDLAGLAAHVLSWGDDEIVLALDSPFEGIVRAVVTNADSKFGTGFSSAIAGDGIFEDDLPFDSTTGDPAVLDAPGDWETRGPLVGLGCKLYHLPAFMPQSDLAPVYQHMRCFDLKTNTWSDLPDLPECLSGISAVMYDGRIVVEGATTYEVFPDRSTTVFPKGQKAEERVYVYDPATGVWTRANSSGMYLGQTIVNDAGQLKLVGGDKPDPSVPPELQEYLTVPVPVTMYDLVTGAGDELVDMPELDWHYLDPQAAVRDGVICLYSFLQEEVLLVRGDGTTLLSEALPAFFLAEEGEPVDSGAWNQSRLYLRHAALAASSEGFVLAGPPAADGSSDIYILRDGSSTFEPYGLRTFDDRVYAQAATAYRGRLFVLGTAWFEPDQRIFRATAMDVPEYPGDIPCDGDPQPGPAPDDAPGPDTASAAEETCFSQGVSDSALPRTGG